MSSPAARHLEIAFREEAARLVGVLTRQFGDFDLAEEAVQDALVEALTRWPHAGSPRRPGAWLQTTARRRAIDRLRREAMGREKLVALAADPLAGAGSTPAADPTSASGCSSCAATPPWAATPSSP